MVTKSAICGFLLKRIFEIKIVVVFFGRGAFSKLRQTFIGKGTYFQDFRSLFYGRPAILIATFYFFGDFYQLKSIFRPHFLTFFTPLIHSHSHPHFNQKSTSQKIMITLLLNQNQLHYPPFKLSIKLSYNILYSLYKKGYRVL